jgi:hypothetical protein
MMLITVLLVTLLAQSTDLLVDPSIYDHIQLGPSEPGKVPKVLPWPGGLPATVRWPRGTCYPAPLDTVIAARLATLELYPSLAQAACDAGLELAQTRCASALRLAEDEARLQQVPRGWPTWAVVVVGVGALTLGSWGGYKVALTFDR